MNWTLHTDLPNSRPLNIFLPNFKHFYNFESYDFSPNFKGEAQKLGPPGPLEVLKVFGWKSKFLAPMTLILNWGKFGVDISIHF